MEESIQKERTAIERQSKSVPQIKAKIEEKNRLQMCFLAKLKHFAPNIKKLREAEKKTAELRESKDSLLTELDEL